jgi:hypothetical protein
MSNHFRDIRYPLAAAADFANNRRLHCPRHGISPQDEALITCSIASTPRRSRSDLSAVAH